MRAMAISICEVSQAEVLLHIAYLLSRFEQVTIAHPSDGPVKGYRISLFGC